jgi:hypothetical protein
MNDKHGRMNDAQQAIWSFSCILTDAYFLHIEPGPFSLRETMFAE